MQPCGKTEKKKAPKAALGGHLPDLGRHLCTDWSLEGFPKAAFFNRKSILKNRNGTEAIQKKHMFNPASS